MMRAHDEKKRPGRECNPAEPQSNANPGQEKPMNIHTHSTADGNAPAGRNLLPNAVGDLESPLCDALNMARITSLLIEQVRLETVDGRRQIVLQEARAEALVWAIYQTETLFKAAHTAWDEVNDLAFDLRRAS